MSIWWILALLLSGAAIAVFLIWLMIVSTKTYH